MEKAKYQVVANWIKSKISSGDFPPEKKISTEHELAEHFQVSRQTVRHGIRTLEQEGLLQSRRGSGTFVVKDSEQIEAVSQKTIGVISTYINSYIFPNIMKGIEGVLSNKGFHMQLLLTNNQVEHETRALKTLLAAGVDGIIVEPTKSALPNPNRYYYEEFRRRGIPVLFFNAAYPQWDFPCVALDDIKTGDMATQHLLDQGHTEIAGLFLSDDLQGHLRYLGYTNALLRSKIELTSGNVVWFSTEDIPQFAQKTGRIKEIVERCTAVVCYNDKIAVNVFALLKEENIAVPEQVSLIGVDDSDLARYAEIRFTTIAHPSEQLGRTVADQMLMSLKKKDFLAGKLFEPELILGDSVRKMNG